MNRDLLKEMEEKASAGMVILWVSDAAGLLCVKAFPDSVNVIPEIEMFSREHFVPGRKFNAIHHGKTIWKSFC